jgi:hypothetical protein
MLGRNAAARYIRVHHWRGLAIAAAALVVDTALSAHTNLSAPAATVSGFITVPLDLQVPLIIVCLVASSLEGPMADLEQTGARTLRRCQLWYLAGATCAAGVLVGGTAALMAPLGTAVVLIRAVAIWTGMALLAGRTLRWNLAWVLPLASFLPLNYFAADNAGRYYWWYWPRQPAGQLPCALIAIGSLAIGACAVAFTPWRLAAFRTAARRMMPSGAIVRRDSRNPRRTEGEAGGGSR